MKALLCALAFAVVMPACAGATASTDDVVRVRIEHSTFIPSSIHVERGATVQFEIVNDDPIDHEFIIGDTRVQTRHERGAHTNHGKIPGEVSVPAGATATTTYEFRRPGKLIIGCHLPAHYEYGMKARVTVAA